MPVIQASTSALSTSTSTINVSRVFDGATTVIGSARSSITYFGGRVNAVSLSDVVANTVASNYDTTKALSNGTAEGFRCSDNTARDYVVSFLVGGTCGGTSSTAPAPGSDKQAEFKFLSASTQWNIPHFFGFKPNVQVFDDLGFQIEACVQHLDTNNLTVSFINPTSGTVQVT